jgi:acetylglutamate synthase
MAHITVYGPREIDQIDQESFGYLVKSGFGRALSDSYFSQDISSVIVADDYVGAAVLIPFMDWMYLDKFVVMPEYRHNGIGASLMSEALRLSSPYGMFWRTNLERQKSIDWYLTKLPHAKHKTIPPWEIFWVGKRHPSHAIHYAIHKKETLK